METVLKEQILNNNRIPTYKMIRELPNNARKVKTINGINLYNINVFQNIMSWNQHNLDVPALEYFGNQITYRQLPREVDAYAKGLQKLGINKDSIITMSLPVSNEYIFSLFAASNMGIISNNVNFLFLRNDLKTYTTRKNSDTMIILDIYLPFVVKQLKDSGIKNVILTSLNDYLPSDKVNYFSDISRFPKNIRDAFSKKDMLSESLEEIKKLKNINFIKMSEIIKVGRECKESIIYPKVNIEKDSIYSYTSGTTGAPKCIVFKEQSPNAIIEMHNGLDLKEYVGDRSLLVIPASHATGMFYATYLQMAKGKTMVLQPIYDKNSYASDLSNYEINHSVASASFYIAGKGQGILSPTAFSKLTRACSGGEPFTKSNAIQINEWLKENGCNEKIAIGGGAGEVGASVLTSYEMNSENKTNETGCPMPGTYVKIVNPITGEIVKKGERGIIHMSSAASADRYLDNETATNEYFYTDSNGIRWGILGDIAVQNEDNSYSILGRSSDSYINSSGETFYLFDIEYSLDINDPILEWEISAFPLINNNYARVAQIVLKDDYIGKKSDIVKLVCDKYKLDAVKFYNSFGTSEVTGKRDYLSLKNDRDGYYAPYDDEHLLKISYLDDNRCFKEMVSLDDINDKELIKKK